MHKNWKKLKLLSIALLVVMLLSTACAVSPATQTTVGKTDATGTAATSAGGATTQAAVKEKVKFIYVMQDRKAACAGDEEVRQFINKKFNVEYEKVNIPADQIQEKMSIIIATGEDWDASYTDYYSPASVRYQAKLIKNKNIQPLNTYLKNVGSNLMKDVPASAWKLATDKDGNTWSIPDVGFASKYILFFRQDWLSKVGLSEPTTIKAFEEMLIKFRDADFDGNGKKDTYPLIGQSSIYDIFFLSAFIKTGNSWYLSGDQLIPFFMADGFKEYLTTIRRWFSEGLIHPDQFVMNAEQIKDVVVKGVCGVYPLWYTLSYQDNIVQVNPAAKVSFMKFPVGSSGTSGAMSTNVTGGGLVINAKTNAKVAERIVEIMDWLQTPEGTNFSWYGIENKHWIKSGDKIAPPSGVDPKTPLYNAQLYINGGNAWKYFTESTLVKPELTSTTRQAAINGKYPSIDPVDYQFVYDWVGTSTETKLSDLEKMYGDMYTKIVTGVEPVSYLDTWISQWKAAGGDNYIKDRTAQYKALK